MAQTKDIITKQILKNIAKEISEHILKIPIVGEIELIDKEFTRVEKRDADLLFANGDRVIHIEIQNDNHLNMENRMLRYYSDILFDYKDYKIKQYVLYIGKRKCSMKSYIRRDNIEFRYTLIDMKDISCEEFLNSDDPSAISLAILCDFEGRDKQEIVNTIIKRLIEKCEDSVEFRTHFKMVEVLSTNRDLENEVKEGEKMLVVDMEKLPSYEIGLEKGIEKGIEKGMQKGFYIGGIEAKKEIAKNALRRGLDMEMIVEITGLSKEEIEEIKIQEELKR